MSGCLLELLLLEKLRSRRPPLDLPSSLIMQPGGAVGRRLLCTILFLLSLSLSIQWSPSLSLYFQGTPVCLGVQLQVQKYVPSKRWVSIPASSY